MLVLAKSVCGLIRLMKSIAAASVAGREAMRRIPSAEWPRSIVSILESMGAPTDSSETPSDSSIIRCPSLVPPPWLPIAGKMNGSAPYERSRATAVRTISGSWSIPRLPTATATRSPLRATGAKSRSSQALVSPLTSVSGWLSSRASTSSGGARSSSDGKSGIHLSSSIGIRGGLTSGLNRRPIQFRLQIQTANDFRLRSVSDCNRRDQILKTTGQNQCLDDA